jgi:DNA repair exonuclease SbcCD ATPase subunit
MKITNRCLVYKSKINTKNTKKGQYKICSTSYVQNKCKCTNCLKWKKQYSKKWQSNNKDRSKQYFVKHYLKNKEKIKNTVKQYKHNNPDKNKEFSRSYSRKRRTIIKNNGFEKYTEAQVLELYGTNCYLCNTPIDMSASRRCGDPGWEKGLHIEHVVDIALGGPDTLANVRPSHAKCNLNKKPREMV